MGEGAEIFEKLDKLVHVQAIDYGEAIEFDKYDFRDFSIIGSYCTIMEQARAILALVDNDLGTHCHSILRSQFETFADMRLSMKNEHYRKNMELDLLESQKKLLKAAKDGNPYLALLVEKFDVDVDLSTVGQAISKLKKAGAKSLGISEKLKNAGMGAEADAILYKLHEFTHGGVRALERRHLKESYGDVEIVCFQSRPIDDFVAEMHSSYDILLRASAEVHAYFSSGHSKIFEELITTADAAH